MADVDEQAAREAAQAISPPSVAAVVDVRDATSVRSAVERTVREAGRLDVWVNAAGVYHLAAARSVRRRLGLVLDTNLRGTFLGSREAARAMVAGNAGGVIVNVSSTAAFRAAAPGAALRRVEVRRPRPHPGARGRARPPRHPRARRRSDGDLDSGSRGTARGAAVGRLRAGGARADAAAGRVAVPDDIARVVLFCASDLSLLMTGSTLLVDAGELV